MLNNAHTSRCDRRQTQQFGAAPMCTSHPLPAATPALSPSAAGLASSIHHHRHHPETRLDLDFSCFRTYSSWSRSHCGQKCTTSHSFLSLGAMCLWSCLRLGLKGLIHNPVIAIIITGKFNIASINTCYF